MQKSDATEKVIQLFKEISLIPRRSKDEDRIAQFLQTWAKDHGFDVTRDQANNVIMRIPATESYENAPTIVLQAHMDMVCEKTPESKHDFSKDPIKLIEKDGWLHAQDTTLGADNGLGLAIALIIATDKSIAHPPLEILLTSDEETGMTGALALNPSEITGRIMLNLDSEDEGVFTIGCAGGRSTRSTVLLYPSAVPQSWIEYSVEISGLSGGHSGVDINCGRANAMKLAARVLRGLFVTAPEILLKSFKSGSAHNAIPRDAQFSVVAPSSILNFLNKSLNATLAILKDEFVKTDPELNISYETAENTGDAYDRSSSEKLVDLLFALPHGVCTMSHEVEGLVESSVNLATAEIQDGKLKIVTSQRSSVASKLDAVTSRVEACTRLANGVAVSEKGYPAWQPNWESEVLKLATKVYQDRFQKQPKIEIIHAGLECGYLGDKFKGMDMLSLGPTILSPHSPLERAEIASISKVYDLLKDILASFKAENA